MADVSNRRRVQAGVPTGGEFSAEQRAENDDLIPEGYLIGADRRDFKDNARRTAPKKDRRTTTPQMAAGSADTPYRNRTYTGGNMALTMPSRSAMDRFEAENGDSFDIPVHAQFGNLPAVSCWVRMHKAANGTWRATPLGLDHNGQTAGIIGEAVSAVKEARRPSSSLRDVGDLILRHKAAKAGREGFTRSLRGASAWMDHIGYNPDTGIMTMETNTGKFYGYQCSQETFNSVLVDPSPGGAFNKLIKTRAPRVEVEKCATCGDIHVEGTIHRCSSKYDKQ